MIETDYSVLMSVYFREKPEFLRSAMQSIYEQTIQTNDFVLVCDGPLTPELDLVIDEMTCKFGSRLNVKRLEQNGGLGNALNIGIKECKNEIVARMDSDDISYSDRCERQLKTLSENPEISVCSGIVEEFSDDPAIVDAIRVLPEFNKDIIKFAKLRNPFNHPCIMYKKTAVERAGGYQEFYLLEDYYLWVRMLMNGSKGYNLQVPLLHMRAGSELYKRRSGWKYVKSQIKLFKFMKDKNFITKRQYLKSVVARLVGSMIPNSVRKIMYKFLLRK